MTQSQSFTPSFRKLWLAVFQTVFQIEVLVFHTIRLHHPHSQRGKGEEEKEIGEDQSTLDQRLPFSYACNAASLVKIYHH